MHLQGPEHDAILAAHGQFASRKGTPSHRSDALLLATLQLGNDPSAIRVDADAVVRGGHCHFEGVRMPTDDPYGTLIPVPCLREAGPTGCGLVFEVGPQEVLDSVSQANDAKRVSCQDLCNLALGRLKLLHSRREVLLEERAEHTLQKTLLDSDQHTPSIVLIGMPGSGRVKHLPDNINFGICGQLEGS